MLQNCMMHISNASLSEAFFTQPNVKFSSFKFNWGILKAYIFFTRIFDTHESSFMTPWVQNRITVGIFFSWQIISIIELKWRTGNALTDRNWLQPNLTSWYLYIHLIVYIDTYIRQHFIIYLHHNDIDSSNFFDITAHIS